MLFSRFEASFLEVHEAFYSMVSIQHLHGNHQKCDPDIRFRPFWSDVCRWLCRKCGPKPWFRLQGNHQKLERNLTFFRGFRRNVLTSEVGEKWLKNGLREPGRPCCFPVLRPRFCRSMKLSTMVSIAFAWKPPKMCDPDFTSFWSDARRWLCRKCGPKPWFRLQGNHQKLERNLIFFRGFRRNVLTSEVGEKWLENGLREPARPCCFPILRPRFLRSTRLSNPPTPASARGSAP